MIRFLAITHPFAITRSFATTRSFAITRFLTIIRSLGCVGAFVASCAVLSAVSPASGASRNVLLMIGDDHGLQAGCYGDKVVRTPGMDRLAASGTRFAHAYGAVSSCSPSRSVMFTGQFNHTNGQYGLAHATHNFYCRPGVPSLPNLLAMAGYHTAIVGKHHVNPPKTFAFTETLSGGHNARALAQAACKFINKPGKTPFFLVVGFHEPHRAQKGFGNPAQGIGAEKFEYDPKDVAVPSWLPDLPETRQELADYYQAISRLDEGVGMVLDALKETGRDKDTLVIYVSDNGPPWPGAKTTLYEPGIHLPMIVAAPGQQRQGVVSEAMVSLVDIAPTILEWARIEPPASMFGRSVLSILQEDHPPGRDVVYGSHSFHEVTMNYPMRMVRTREYKYILNLAWPLEYPFASDLYGSMTWQAVLNGGLTQYGRRAVRDLLHRPKEELYDLRKDPDEMKNLADDPAMKDVLERMRADLKAWREKTEDPWLVKYTHE